MCVTVRAYAYRRSRANLKILYRHRSIYADIMRGTTLWEEVSTDIDQHMDESMDIIMNRLHNLYHHVCAVTNKKFILS